MTYSKKINVKTNDIQGSKSFHSDFNYVYVIHSDVSNSATSWTVAFQAPLFLEFSRQEYWSGLPFPSPGDHPDPGIEPTSPALQADSLPLSHQGSQMFASCSCLTPVCIPSLNPHVEAPIPCGCIWGKDL